MIVTTDKIAYLVGEIVRIGIENDLDTEVRLRDSVECLDGGAWRSVTGDAETHIVLPRGLRFMLLPHTKTSIEWNQTAHGTLVGTGRYRIKMIVSSLNVSGEEETPYEAYSDEFTIS